MHTSRRTTYRLAVWLCLLLTLFSTACQPLIRPATAPPTTPSAPEEAANLAGAYQGNLKIAGQELAIRITLQRDGDAYRGAIDIPQQGATGIPLHDIVVELPNISFQMLEGAQLGAFAGAIDATGVISGTFTQSGYEGSFAISATEEEPTAIAPAEAAAAGAESYRDPQGLFTAPIPTNWTVTEGDGFALLTDPENQIKVYLLTLPAPTGDLAAAIEAGWAKVDPTFDLAQADTVEPPTSQGIEKNLVITYDTPQERIVQAGALLYQDVAYLFLFDGELAAVQKRAAQINIIQSGLDILAMEETDLSTATPLTVDENITGELEAFIAEWQPQFQIPGVAVAIVQNGAVVYSRAFGVRNEAGDPLTPQTQMMIGSTGKSLTTLMMATLVDDGNMNWDTPAIEIYPQFAVKDPELSKTITMRNLVCACTGVPRRDLEFILNANELSAEDVVASLRDFEFFTDFGEAFQYSNQMVATGGYIAAVADSGEQTNLLANYADALQRRVLAPVGMSHTTISFDAVLADDAYATPHGYNYRNEYVPISPDLEKVLVPVAPAGVHWSTLADMAQYMIMQLGEGVAADGTRVVSVENLAEVRKPQIQVADKVSYGLGWFISDYKGQLMIDHGGNTLGFTSEFKFLPEAQLGIVVLTNAQGTNVFSGAVSERLLELVFEQESEVAQSLTFVLEQIAEAGEKLAGQLVGAIDAAAVTPYVGDYRNDALGAMTVTFQDGVLRAEFGEFASDLLPKNDDKGAFEGYIFADPPLPGLLLSFEEDEADQPIIVMGAGVTEYTFTPIE
ncbi:MAG: hypothetical protein DYG89_41820 [Caldilinea sp. CFX5]|nr:hypothetical protein [Caldilinea sp. CFX5]